MSRSGAGKLPEIPNAFAPYEEPIFDVFRLT